MKGRLWINNEIKIEHIDHSWEEATSGNKIWMKQYKCDKDAIDFESWTPPSHFTLRFLYLSSHIGVAVML